MHSLSLASGSAWPPVSRTMAANVLCFRNAVGGLGVLRRALTAVQIKAPFTTYLRAYEALDSGDVAPFEEHVRSIGCMGTANEANIVKSLGPELTVTKQCVQSQAYKAMNTPADNALLEDCHARNRGFLMKRTISVTWSARFHWLPNHRDRKPVTFTSFLPS